MLQGFVRGLAHVAFLLRNITLLGIIMKAIWRAIFLNGHKQANECDNSGETEEVLFIFADFVYVVRYVDTFLSPLQAASHLILLCHHHAIASKHKINLVERMHKIRCHLKGQKLCTFNISLSPRNLACLWQGSLDPLEMERPSS